MIILDDYTVPAVEKGSRGVREKLAGCANGETISKGEKPFERY
jgi:hypothetical protein